MKLNDFLNKLDKNFQIGVTIIDPENNYYCVDQDDYDTLSKESVEKQKQYLLKQDFDIENIKSMYFKKDFIKIYIK